MSTSIRFNFIKMRNFLSFGNTMTEVDLTYPRSTLIQGENLDTGGANGVGKTTIINAVCYSLYNKPFDAISLQRLINSTNAAKNTQMEVHLNFHKGEDEFEISRYRGELTTIKILKNGEDITLDSVAGNDSLVEDIVGISYDLFTRVIIFSGSSVPFLQLPVSLQRSQIEELFNITVLTEKAVKLKEMVKIVESDLTIQKALLTEHNSQHERHKKQVAEALRRVQNWSTQNASEILVLEKKKASYSSIDFAAELEVHELLAAEKTRLADIQHKISPLKTDVRRLDADIQKLQAEISHLKDAKCPYCLQKYEDAASKITEEEQRLAAKLEAKTVAETKLSELVAAEAEIKTLVSECEGSVTFNSAAATVKAQTEMATLEEQISRLQSALNPHSEAYDQLNEVEFQTSDASTKVDELTKRLDHMQFLHKLLTSKDSFIRKRFINKTIPFLNGRLSFYTKELGLPHIVKFDVDMSCTVTEFGRELDYGNLSSGEKKRTNLALSLAFRDVVHHLNARFNCMFIDEIEGSLDQPGVDDVFRLLKTKAKSEDMGLWIISHHPSAIDRFERTVKVRKENGFATFLAD